MAGNRRLKTTVLYGFPLNDPGDMMPKNLDRRFLCCSECAAPLEAALTCSACEAAIYCNISCQKAAWTKGHKQQCADLKQDRKNSNGTIGMYQPPLRNAATSDKAKAMAGEAVKDWIFQNMQAITVLAKLNVGGKEDLAIKYHTYIVLLPRTIRKKNQPDGYRLVINSVFRVNRDRDPGVYRDEYDGKLLKRGDDQHMVQLCTANTGFHGIVLSTSAVIDAVAPDLSVHALVNMYNSNLQDLTVTASRTAPEFAAYWKKQEGASGKQDHVLDKEAKELGVDNIPEDVMERLFDMLAEAMESEEGLQLREVGREVIRADGRKEYIPSGYTINGRPVEAAAHPFLKYMAKNTSTSNFALEDNPDSMRRNNVDRQEIRRHLYKTVLGSVKNDPTGHGQPKETLMEDLLGMVLKEPAQGGRNGKDKAKPDKSLNTKSP